MKFLKITAMVVGVVALAATGVGIALGGMTAAASIAGSTAALGATIMSVGTIASVAGGAVPAASIYLKGGP